MIIIIQVFLIILTIIYIVVSEPLYKCATQLIWMANIGCFVLILLASKQQAKYFGIMQDICKMDSSKVPSRFFPDSLNQLASKCIVDSEGTLDSLIQLQSQYDLVSEL